MIGFDKPPIPIKFLISTIRLGICRCDDSYCLTRVVIVKIRERCSTDARNMKQYSQSKCFFLGAIISSVVALQTDFANPWPAMLWRAAKSLSFIV